MIEAIADVQMKTFGSDISFSVFRFGLFSFVCLRGPRVCLPACRLDTICVDCAGSDCVPAATNRELPRFKHRISRGHAHVSGRGCFHCFCDDGSLLQVSCSTQKLLPVPQVSEQNEPGSLTHCSWLRFLSYNSLLSFSLLLYSFLLVNTCCVVDNRHENTDFNDKPNRGRQIPLTEL